MAWTAGQSLGVIGPMGRRTRRASIHYLVSGLTGTGSQRAVRTSRGDTGRERDLLAGRYAVGEAIGQGRSTVYRGEDVRLRRRVAIKRVQLDAGPEAAGATRSRAMREAQAAARLSNPRAVTVFDVVEEGGSVWLVMELVEAPSLAAVVEEHGPLPHRRAATIGLDVLEALAAAHRVGVVHRDVKPANVLVGPGDRAKLTDFGVARIRDEAKLTATGHIIGSPAYMAPEQARGEVVGPGADLWALGATLYFAVEGVPPFPGTSAIAVATAVVHGRHRPAARPGPLTDIIGRLLSKEPADRPRAEEVRRALRSAQRSSTDRPAAPPVDPGSPRTGTQTTPASGHDAPRAGGDTEAFPALAGAGHALADPAGPVGGTRTPDGTGAALSLPAAAATGLVAGTARAPAGSAPDEAVSIRSDAPPTAATARPPQPAPGVGPAGSPSPTASGKVIGQVDESPVAGVVPAREASGRDGATRATPDRAQPSGHTLVGSRRRRTGMARTGDDRRARLVALVVTALVALAVVALMVQRTSDDGQRAPDGSVDGETTGGTTTSEGPRGTRASAEPAATSTSPTDPPRAQVPPTDGASAEVSSTTQATRAAASTAPASGPLVPNGWTPFADPDGAYTIAHPPGWTVTQGSRDHTTYFKEPGTGTYLLVEWTPDPKPDPVADWQEQSEYFGNRHEGYDELRIEPYSYRDYNAALWEFRYRDGGTLLHTGNLGFVAEGRGYALYFQTRDQNWDAGQGTFARFREAFAPAP
jgi:eukaryotic-like serine/threonine-protein kinase